MFYEAFLAGLFASIGRTLGKLLAAPSIIGDSYVIWGVLVLAMVLAKILGCRHYLRSLDAASNSAASTIVSSGSSYVISGVIGVTLFEEPTCERWWVGAMLIVLGLALVAQAEQVSTVEQADQDDQASAVAQADQASTVAQADQADQARTKNKERRKKKK